MRKKSVSKTNVYETGWKHLQIESTKLRALAHLIEVQDDEGAVPLDIRDIQWGVGMLLSRIAERVRRIAVQLEDQELGKIKKRGK